MKESGKMTSNMGSEQKYGRMTRNIKVTSNTARRTAKENINGVMAANMKECGRITKQKDKERMYGLIRGLTLAIGLTT